MGGDHNSTNTCSSKVTCQNFVDEKTSNVDGMDHNCGFVALSLPVVENKKDKETSSDVPRMIGGTITHYHHCEIDQQNVVAVDDNNSNNDTSPTTSSTPMDMDMDIDMDTPEQQQQNDDIEEDGVEIAIGDDDNNNNWEFTKTLTASDIASQQSRLILPTTFVHNHIFLNNEELRNRIDNDKQVVEIFFFDSNLKHGFLLNLKKWKTNSYVLISGWQKRVVDARNLKKGDVIGLRWDPLYFGLKFSVLHKNVANLNVANL